jgi:hypothetical protein
MPKQGLGVRGVVGPIGVELHLGLSLYLVSPAHRPMWFGSRYELLIYLVGLDIVRRDHLLKHLRVATIVHRNAPETSLKLHTPLRSISCLCVRVLTHAKCDMEALVYGIDRGRPLGLTKSQ